MIFKTTDFGRCSVIVGIGQLARTVVYTGYTHKLIIIITYMYKAPFLSRARGAL